MTNYRHRLLGYRDGMMRRHPLPQYCTPDYYAGLRAAIRERVWRVQARINQIRSAV